MTNVEPTVSYKDFGNMDMVIEAVFEDIKIKHAVIKELEQVLSVLFVGHYILISMFPVGVT